MPLPIHKNPSSARTASAPYNFVPLPEEKELFSVPPQALPDQDRFHSDRKTGYFEVELTVKSPLYVRCALPLPDFLRSESEEENKRPFRDRAKNKPDFFYTHDPKQPVIPGSSLRGMLRNLLEAVSYGKMAEVMKSPKIFFRAVAAEAEDPLKQPYVDVIGNMAKNVRAGYLIKHGDQWKIQPACALKSLQSKNNQKRDDRNDKKRPEKNYLRIKEADIPDGKISNLKRLNDRDYRPQYHKISFELGQETKWVFNKKLGRKISFQEAKATAIGDLDAGLSNKGYLVCTGNMLETGDETQESPRKTFVIVPKPDTSPNAKTINPQAVQDYLDALTDFQKEEPFDKQMGMLKEGRPVFYVDEEGEEIFYFGHCPNFRIPAVLHPERRAATPNDFVPDYCKEVKTIDFAEALFGHTKGPNSGAKPGDKAYAYASRVFVTDAKCDEHEPWLQATPLVPRILASPKPTAFQHYLVQRYPDTPRQLYHYGNWNKTAIRGHKFYWHQGRDESFSAAQWQIAISEEKKKLEELPKDDTQHTQFKPVKPKTIFTFRVYFENLSDVELGALCWVLQPLGHPDLSKQQRELCHHLGMGKPLGMGSVKLSAMLFFTERKARYEKLFDGNDWQTGVRKTNGKPVPESLEEYRTKFEKEVLTKLQLHSKYEHLYDLKRIAMLLKLMEWPGYPAVLPARPDNRMVTDQDGTTRPNTRYMTIRFEDESIATEDRNEYRHRPVLPDPEAFGGLLGAQDKPENNEPQAHGSSASLGPKPKTSKPPKQKPAPLPSTKPKDTKPKSQQSQPKSAKAAPPSPPAPPATAPAGFSGTKERVWVTVAKLISSGKVQIQTEQGEEVPCTNLPGYPAPEVGQKFRANVTYEKGKAVKAIFKGWK
jgi:CRISPR-associated protein (TIGR03986 family)